MVWWILCISGLYIADLLILVGFKFVQKSSNPKPSRIGKDFQSNQETDSILEPYCRRLLRQLYLDSWAGFWICCRLGSVDEDPSKERPKWMIDAQVMPSGTSVAETHRELVIWNGFAHQSFGGHNSLVWGPNDLILVAILKYTSWTWCWPFELLNSPYRSVQLIPGKTGKNVSFLKNNRKHIIQPY